MADETAPPTEPAPTCSEPGCDTTRTDEPDYSPVQPVLGKPLGWYSGDDGEFCPRHLAELMAMGNRRTYSYHLPGGGTATT